jgi:hypothetical protein
VLLRDVYEVRSGMHELYKAYRADHCASLYADFLADKTKTAEQALYEQDGDTELKRACRDGNEAEAGRLLELSVDSGECSAQPTILKAQLLDLYKRHSPRCVRGRNNRQQ